MQASTMGILNVGYSATDITPPPGIAMAGYGSRDRGAEAVEAPLLAQALVVQAGEGVAAMAFTDLLGLDPELVTGIRKRVAARTGISPDCVMVCGSHTHWGPATDYTAYMPASARELVSQGYHERLVDAVADVLVSAWERRKPASASWGVGLADGISYNRRTVGADGRSDMRFSLPAEGAAAAAAAGLAMRRQWRTGGFGGPRLSEPLAALGGIRAGVSDPEIPLLKLLASDGTPLCGLVGFACHPVAGGADEASVYAFSPDYVQQARQAFHAVTGAPLAFALGCAGDQVPAWRGADSRERVGRSLGAAAARAWYQIRDCAQRPIVGTCRRVVQLPGQPAEVIAQARRELAQADDPESVGMGTNRQTVAWADGRLGSGGLETELWAVRLGDWAAVTLPGEVLVEIGLQIRQRSPFAVTAVISCANDSIGYLVTEQSRVEGGYEPTWGASGPGTETIVVRTALEMLRELRAVESEYAQPSLQL